MWKIAMLAGLPALIMFARVQVVHAQTDLGQIMALGDSITYGEDPDAYELNSGDAGAYPGGYRTQFYNRLTQAGYTFQFVGSRTDSTGSYTTDPNGFDNPSQTLKDANEAAVTAYPGIIIGRDPTHYNPPNSDGGLYANLSADTQAKEQTAGVQPAGNPYIGGNIMPNSVLLMAGINNFIQNYGEQETVAEMNDLLTAIFDADKSTHVYLSTLLPYARNDDPNSIKENIQSFNSDLQNLVVNFRNADDQITLVDAYSAFVLDSGAPNLNLYSSDQIHPDADGYTRLGDVFANAVLDSVAAPEPTSATLLSVGVIGLLGRPRRPTRPSP